MHTSSPVTRSSRRTRLWAALAVITLLAGAPWLALRADIPRVDSGTWLSAGDVGTLPAGASAVGLPDGRVLVSGGLQDGAPVAAVMSFEAASGGWASVGSLMVARTGHASVVLAKGRVLIAGGRTADGPSFDVEIFDPATGVSAHAGDLALARVDAAAAALADGRVLIVGGSSGDAPLSLAEIFDPATGLSVPVMSPMSVARTRATATTMLDGHVLVVGGSDGTSDLATAEIFDPASQSFFATGGLQTPRSGHTAVLLPNNNQVLIAGGQSAGTAVASAELYADWRDGFLSAPSPMSAPRTGGVAAPLAGHDLAFVAGGGPVTAEYFGYATVKTDRADYWPGEPVTVTGSGWQPGETVTITISEDADTHYDFTYSAIADEQGRITNSEFAPIENEVFHHFGKKFYVEARGAAWQALNTFTDGNVKVNVSPTTDSASTAGHMFIVNEFTSTNCTGSFTVSNKSPFAVGAGKTETIGGTGASTQVLAPATDDQGAPFSAWFNTGGYISSGASLCVTSSSSGSQIVTAVYGTATSSKIVFTNSPINALTNSCSLMGVQTQNSSGTATAPFANTSVQLTTTSGGGAFYSNSTCTTAITSTTITTASANSPGFYYKDTAAGTPTVKADPSATTSMAPITQAETINATCTVPAGVSIIPNGAVAKNVGDALTFTGAATSGTPTLHYVWKKDGVAIGGAPDNPTYTISAVALTDAGTYTVVVSNGCSTGVTSANSAVVSVTRVATALTVAPASGTYGGSTASALTATLTSGGNGVSGKTITFTLNGTSAGTATTNASGVATLAAVSSLAGINAGSYAAGVSASFTQDATYAGQTASNALTVSKAQLSVKANDQTKTYDGAVFSAFTASVSGFVAGDSEAALRGSGALMGAAVYTGAATAAVNASVTPYVITPTLGTLTATNYTFGFVSGNLTITPAVATVKANAKSKTYGADNPVLDAVVTGAVGSETLNYSLATTALVSSGVGSYPITVTLGTNPNYTVTKTDAELTINPAVATVTANAKSKTYGADNPTLDAVVTGAVSGDTLNYSLATTALVSSGVGSYPITVTLGANPNYTVTKTDAVLTINPAVATVAANAKSKTYGAANPALDAVVTGQVTGGDAVAYSLATPATTTSGVGSYAITVTLGANPNYDVTSTDSTLTVSKATANVAANAKSKTYGAANPSLDAVVTGQVTGGDAIAYSLATPALTTSGVGSYAITVTLGANPNYDVTSTDSTLTVSKATANVAANAKSKTYGAANPALDAVVTGQVTGGDAVAYSLATPATTTSGVGSYAITVTLGANPNYDVTSTDGTLTVSKAVATVTANAKSKTYGAANPALDAVVTGQVTGGDAVAYSLATPATTTSGVGSYAITVTLGANPNYDVTSTDSTLTVSKATANVAANAKSKTYGAANPALDAMVAGQAAGGDVLNYSLATTATTTSGVGSYAIIVTLGANPNYDVTSTDSTLTVSKATANVAANAKSKTYGAANPALDAVVSGQVTGGDAVAYSLATPATTTSGVGSYAITVTLGANPNYDVTSTDSTLTVNKATATVAANAKSKTYGAANPALDAVVTGQVTGGDAVAYSLATPATTTSGVGSYAITVTLGANPNYDVTSTDSTLTVSKATATVAANAKNKTYGAANPVLDAVVTGQVPGGDTLNYSLATTATTTSGIGSYPIAVTLGANPNYDLSSTDSTLTVSKATATVTANGKSKVYGDANPVLDATVTGTVNGDALSYTLASAADTTSGVGSYPISVTLGANPNYTVSSTNGLLTVTKAALTVTTNAATKVYGAGNPAFSVSYATFVNGDAAASLGGTVVFTTAATAASAAGSYDVTPSGLTSANYNITFVKGTLTVAKAPLTVTTNAATKVYGAANPAFTVSYATLVNGDTPAVLGGTLGFTTSATPASPVADYDVTPNGLTSLNYAITFVKGTLTVNKATVTVTADNKVKLLNAANPTLTAKLTGFVNGETMATSGISGAAGMTTTAAGNSPIGSYPITAATGTLVSANYSFVFVNGTLDIRYAWDGFLQPINDTAHDLTAMSKFKLGQTIPAKFDLKDANGAVVQQSVSPMFNLKLVGAACDAAQTDSVDSMYTPSTQPIYALTGGHYQYNWSTKGMAAGLYRIFAMLNDGTTQSVDICLSK